MVEGAPWSRVVKEIETIIMTFPSLEGFMVRMIRQHHRWWR